MPQLPPVPGVTRAVMNYTTNGVKTANVLHFTQPPGPTPPPLADLADGLKTWWNNNVKGLVGTAQVLTSITCTDLSSASGQTLEYSTGLPLTGTVAGDMMPGMVAAVVSWKTAQRGRSFRGRTYVGGLVESQCAGNVLEVNWRASMLAAWNQLIIFTGGPLTPDYALVIVSYRSGGAVRGTPLATPVISGSMNALPDTQRRRMR